MALQRTRRPRIRSGRSLRSLGSPLNARPLGGWKLRLTFASDILVASLFLGSGCKTVDGRLYPIWTGSIARIDVSPQTTVPDGALVRVVAFDQSRTALPGVTVSASRPGSDLHLRDYTGADGSVALSLVPARWRIDISFPGFKPVRRTMTLSAGQEFTVTCLLEFEKVVTVT